MRALPLRTMALGACATLLVAGVPAAAQADDDDLPVVLVQSRHAGPAISSKLTGVNNDQWFDLSHGLWDADGTPDERAVAKTAQAGVNIVRYPGGTPANFYDWTRAVGPDRQCQTDGRPGNGTVRDSVYGPDEHMEFVEAAGADASIMSPFVKQTPEQAAGWVEYMNGSVETAHGSTRAANGHPAPYGVRYWEVGNEHDRAEQRYWMSPDNATALRQYAFGGTQPQGDQLLGRGCDFTDDVASDGTANQVFGVPYPPVVPDSQAVTVEGEPWAEVADLAAAGPQDAVYEVDDATGAVRFGDGEHGAVPPSGAQVRASYGSGPHAGFVDFYAAMKAADPSIDVCATWAPITADTGLGGESFPEVMAEAGHGADYDCLIVHPYTNFKRQFGDTVHDAQQMHDWQMLGEAEATEVLRYHAATVAEHGRPDAYVTSSELGALFFGPHDAREYLSWNTAMSHATYFASQWTRLAELGVPWAEGNTLVSETPGGLRAVLGGEPAFAYTSEAVVRESLRPLVEGGGTVVANRVQENPVVVTDEQPSSPSTPTSYEAFATTATLDADGVLNILVVNRDSTHDILANVVPAGYHHGGTATVSSVLGENDDPNRESFESHNTRDPDHQEVTLRGPVPVEIGGGAFRYTFPKHSVTLIRLSPR